MGVGFFCPKTKIMTLIIRKVKSPKEKENSNSLIQRIYKDAFDFDYDAVVRLSPDFKKIPFIAYSESKFDIIGTATLSLETNGYFPSEYYFGYRIPPELRCQKLVEIGRLAKEKTVSLTPEEEKLTLLSLLLAIKEYSMANQVDGWVATVHSKLLNEIKQIGINVKVLAHNGAIETAITKAMGSYPNDIHFIYATMEDSYRNLEKFQYLLLNGTISIETEKPVLT